MAALALIGNGPHLFALGELAVAHGAALRLADSVLDTFCGSRRFGYFILYLGGWPVNFLLDPNTQYTQFIKNISNHSSCSGFVGVAVVTCRRRGR